MTLHELESPEALHAFCTGNANALVCFSATWCGPCRASKPTLMDLAVEYEKDPAKDLKVGIVYEHQLSEAIHAYQVKAFPTYILYCGQKEAGRIEGANFSGIRELVNSHGCKKDLGAGHSLGSGGGHQQLSAEEARQMRLAKFASSAAPSPATTDTKPAAEEEKFEAQHNETEKDVVMKSAADDRKEDGEAELEMSDPTEGLSQELIETLTASMGFTLVRAQKGLLNGGGTLDGAIDWITAHQDDDDIDEPITQVTKSGGVAQSYKCNECGKILSNMANLELHANKSGHSDFEESTQAVKPLTAEEKAVKILQIKSLLKAKRAEREETEKGEEIDREKQRRFMGKEMAKTREEMERDARKRDVSERKREKENAKRERERIRAELEKDKAERRANAGKLHSRLGVDGYNPDAIQYDAPIEGSSAMTLTTEATASPQKPKVSVAKIDEYISKISSYRAGGDGGKCLKTLLAYVGNVVDKPDEDKFRSINIDNKIFKTRVKPFVGAKSLLLVVGFSQNEGGDALILDEDANRDVLAMTKTKLENALAAY